jgi:murein L,D-transpeptidase YafK
MLSSLALGLGWATWPEQRPLHPGSVADAVLIDKGDKTLSLIRDGRVLKTYRVSFGGNPVGHKQREGDERTPEGSYRIEGRNPRSGFHRSLHVSYPNRRDVERARAAGVSPGGDIMIHGIRNRLGWLGRMHRWVNWTDGCVAVTNREMDEIWRAVPDGTPIEIRP